ncbi:MAG: periplasmic heavy metal sensor, partial [Aestuariivirga sp.]
MTDRTSPILVKNGIPHLRSRWWTVLLVASLGINLLIAGVVAGRAFNGPPGGIAPQGFGQLVPRKFFDDLPRQRRDELMGVIRDNRDEFKAMRQQAQATALKLADVLEDPNYDPEKAKAVIADFTTGANSLASRGGAVSLALLGKLTAD